MTDFSGGESRDDADIFRSTIKGDGRNPVTFGQDIASQSAARSGDNDLDSILAQVLSDLGQTAAASVLARIKRAIGDIILGQHEEGTWGEVNPSGAQGGLAAAESWTADSAKAAAYTAPALNLPAPGKFVVAQIPLGADPRQHIMREPSAHFGNIDAHLNEIRHLATDANWDYYENQVRVSGRISLRSSSRLVGQSTWAGKLGALSLEDVDRHLAEALTDPVVNGSQLTFTKVDGSTVTVDIEALAADPQNLYDTLAADDMETDDFLPYWRQVHSETTTWAAQARTGNLAAREGVAAVGTPEEGVFFGGRGSGTTVYGDLHKWELTSAGITVSAVTINNDGRGGVTAPRKPRAQFSCDMIANADLSRIVLFPGGYFQSGTTNRRNYTQVWGLERQSNGSYTARKFAASGSSFTGRVDIKAAGSVERGVMGYGVTGNSNYRDEMYGYEIDWDDYTIAIHLLDPTGDQPLARSGHMMKGESHHIEEDTVDGIIGFGYDGSNHHNDIYRFHANLDHRQIEYFRLDRIGAEVSPRSTIVANGDGVQGAVGFGYDGSTHFRDLYRYSLIGNEIHYTALQSGGAPTGRFGAMLVGDQHNGLVGLGQDSVGYKNDFATFEVGGSTWERKRLTLDSIERTARAASIQNRVNRHFLLWEHTDARDDWHRSVDGATHGGPVLGAGVGQRIWDGLGGNADTAWARFEAEIRWSESISGGHMDHIAIISFPAWRTGTLPFNPGNVTRLWGEGHVGGITDSGTVFGYIGLPQRGDASSENSHLYLEGWNASGNTGIDSGTNITVRLFGVRR